MLTVQTRKENKIKLQIIIIMKISKKYIKDTQRKTNKQGRKTKEKYPRRRG